MGFLSESSVSGRGIHIVLVAEVGFYSCIGGIGGIPTCI